MIELVTKSDIEFMVLSLAIIVITLVTINGALNLASWRIEARTEQEEEYSFANISEHDASYYYHSLLLALIANVVSLVTLTVI